MPVPTWIVRVRIETEYTIEIPAPDASIAEVIAESYSPARVVAQATQTSEPRTYAGAAQRKEPEQ